MLTVGFSPKSRVMWVDIVVWGLLNSLNASKIWIEVERVMIQTIEAVIDEQGKVQLLQNVRLSHVRRALVTILEEEPVVAVSQTALLSEAALAEDWNRPEEEDAWSYLQSEK